MNEGGLRRQQQQPIRKKDLFSTLESAGESCYDNYMYIENLE